MGKIFEFIARPFRDSARINRKVVVGTLERLSSGGLFLEIGPGEAPLLDSIRISGKQKIFIDLPGAFPKNKISGVRYIEQDAGVEQWKLGAESVDVIVSSQCLEHIPYTDHFISEARRVLKKGGAFLLSVPNQGALAFILMMLLTVNPTMNEVSDHYIGLGNPFSTHRYKKRENYHGHAHLRLFSIRAMKDLLKVYGFSVVKCHGGTWGLPLIGEALARMIPYYGLFTIVMARKI